MKVNLVENRLAMFIVCEAIGEQRELINQFDHGQGGEHEIVFTVDGVELNFLNVINAIDKSFDHAVQKRAGMLYVEQCDKRSEEIQMELEAILDRLKEIRNTKFPDINW